MCMSVIHPFYHCFSYRSEPFSVHFVARFITARHFVAMYACSKLHMPHTNIAMAPCYVAHTVTCPRARP